MPENKIRTSIRVRRSTLETLADIAREQGFATIGRANASAAIDYVTEFYRRMNGHQLVDPPAPYCTAERVG